MAIEVTPVKGFKDKKAFVNLPFRLHAGTPWIPPLKLERYGYLSKSFNPFFKHGEAQLWLARKDGRVVGRISAQVDNHYNEHHGLKWGMFGFLEFEEDQEILDALLAVVKPWLLERGCDRIVGPMDFIINEESGILIEGFELEPMIRQPWHPPYYQRMVEAAGLTKAQDLYHWKLHISDREERMLPILPKLAERVESKHGIKLRKMTRRSLKKDLRDFVQIYNDAWSHNWGFVPYTKDEMFDLWFNYQLVFGRGWFMVAENERETVAIAITIPDIHQVYKKMNGRLLPLGWWYYLRRNAIIDRCRIGFLGVKPEYQHTGVAAKLYIEHYDMADSTRIKTGEAGWILESNKSMNRGLEAMGGSIVKKNRIYDLLPQPAGDASAAEASASD
jgi:GNAT superfamily N-acetyltransferase